MLKKPVCKQPVRRLLMMRAKGLSSPFFQKVTNNSGGKCMKSTGQYWGPSGAGWPE